MMALAFANIVVYYCTLGLGWSSSVPIVPTDVKIDINQAALTANLSWNIPTGINVTDTSLSLWDSEGRYRIFYKYIRPPCCHYKLHQHLQQCMVYQVSLEFRDGNDWSDRIFYKFAMSDKHYIGTIGSTVTMKWSGKSNADYSVISPAGDVIHEATSVNRKWSSEVRKVKENDEGLYTIFQKCKRDVEDCALLIVSVPNPPHLSVFPEHAFIGERVMFTCTPVRSWLFNDQPKFTYNYSGINGIQFEGTLVMLELEKDTKGLNVTCTTIDDNNKRSSPSNQITVDSNYGPGDIKIQPYKSVIEISEGETLGPYECTADCNPPCLVRWSSNGGSNMELEGSTLNITNITRYQKGTYKCDVIHKNDHRRHKQKSITVNVIYKPDVPGSVYLTDYSHDYATISFVAGSDGGSKQTFFVRSRPIDDSVPSASIEEEIFTKDIRNNAKISYSIKGLLPDTRYSITLSATNKVGFSVAHLEVKTNNICKPCSFNAKTGVFSKFNIIVVGSLAAVVVLLLVVLIVICIKFQQEKRKNQRQTSASLVNRTSADYANCPVQAREELSSVVQRNREREASHYMNAGLLVTTSASSACDYLSLRRQDKTPAYDMVRLKTTGGNGEKIYANVK